MLPSNQRPDMMDVSFDSQSLIGSGGYRTPDLQGNFPALVSGNPPTAANPFDGIFTPSSMGEPTGLAIAGMPTALGPPQMQQSGMLRGGTPPGLLALQAEAQSTPVDISGAWRLRMQTVTAELARSDDTPEKQALRYQVANLQAEMHQVEEYASIRAQQYVETQTQKFIEVSRLFEEQAKEVTQTELAQSDARSRAKARVEIDALVRRANSELQASQNARVQAQLASNARATLEEQAAISKARLVITEESEEALRLQGEEKDEAYNTLFQSAEATLQSEAETLRALTHKLEVSERDKLELAEQRQRQVAAAETQTANIKQLLQSTRDQLEQSFSQSSVDALREQLEISQKLHLASHAQMNEMEERFKSEFAQLRESMQYECDQLREQNDAKSELMKDLEDELERTQDMHRAQKNLSSAFGASAVQSGTAVASGVALSPPKAVKDLSGNSDSPFQDALETFPANASQPILHVPTAQRLNFQSDPAAMSCGVAPTSLPQEPQAKAVPSSPQVNREAPDPEVRSGHGSTPEPRVVAAAKASASKAWMQFADTWWSTVQHEAVPGTPSQHSLVAPQFYQNISPQQADAAQSARPSQPSKAIPAVESTMAAFPGVPSSSAALPSQTVIDNKANEKLAGADPIVEATEKLLSQAPASAEATTIKFESFPNAPKFREWRLKFKEKVASSSKTPKEAFAWISEIDKAVNLSDLSDSGKFETLDFKIASGLNDIIHGEFSRKIIL